MLRRLSPLDWISLAVLLLYILLRVLAALGRPIPFTSFVGFLVFLAVLYFAIRILPWVRTQLLWRLRSRLIVAYLFIAVVPVVLLLAMAAVGGYLLYLQFGAHLLSDQLNDRISTIATDTDAISDAIEATGAKGGASIGEGVLTHPGISGLLSAARDRGMDLQVFLDRGQQLLKPGTDRFSGLVEFEGKLWLAAAERRRGKNGPVFVMTGMPLTPAVLDSVGSEIGPVQLILLEPAAGRPASGLSLEIDNRLYVPGQQIISNRTLGPPANWFDRRVNGASTLEAVHVEPGADSSPLPVLASFSLRPMTINRQLFTSVGAVGPLLSNLLVLAGIVFLVLEIAALITGVVLTRTITRAVGDLYEATLHVRRGDFSYRVRVHQRDQLGALGDSFNEMTSSVSDLIAEQRQRQRLENEISIAREVQEHLFPRSLPQAPGLQLAAICRPARTVSGDYYDFIRLSPTRIGIAVADISGKGIFAALLMASLQAALRSMAALDGRGGTATLVSRLNDHLFKNTADDRYATFFYAVYDAESSTLTYTNAGHLAPFFVNDAGVQQLDEGGTVVGLFEDAPYTQGTLKVLPGSVLVAFSDGLTEPENVYGEEFGMHRLKEEILRQRNIAPQRLAENLITAAEQWAGTPEQADDITVVVARMG